MISRLRALPVLVAVVFLGALLFGWALESTPGSIEKAEEALPEQRAPTGQRLYMLIIDSLSERDLERLPALQALGDEGFSATVQPCTDNFTTACVREALTGRRRASLFSVLEDFKVIAPSVGANLLEDAQALGLRTALLTAGNLRTWSSRVDDEIRIDRAGGKPEVYLALQASQNYEIVVHHWIWLDVASHHRAQPKKYLQAQDDTNAIVARLSERLDPSIGLLVTGDHGHTKDGRHIEGLDVPTYVAARSPNLRSVHPEGRIPITALRVLTAAITGVWNPTLEVPVEYTDWLTDPTAPPIVAAPQPDTGPGLGPVFVAAGLLGALALLTIEPAGALATLAIALLLGVTFPWFVQHASQRGSADDFVGMLWLLPLAFGAVAWLRDRRTESLALGAAIGGVALLVGLWPGLAPFAVLRNLDLAVLPGLAVFALVGLLRSRDRQALWSAALVLVGIGALAAALQFDSNHFRIRSYPFAALAKPALLGQGISMVLGGVAAGMVNRHPLSVLAGAAAVGLGMVLPTALQAVAVVALLGALVTDRPKLTGLLALAAGGFMLPMKRELAMLALVVAVGISLRALHAVASRDQRLDRAMPWMIALLLLVSAYAGLGITMGLTVGGINFNFAVPWFPGRWHMHLWWLVAMAMVLKMFLPTVLVWVIARVVLGAEALSTALDRGTRLALLRFVATTFLLAGWFLATPPSLESSRLRALLFDSFGWLLIGVMLCGLWMRQRRAVGRPSSAGLQA